EFGDAGVPALEGDTDADLVIAAADPGKLGAVELRRLLAEQRIKSGAASNDGEHRAVLGGNAIEPVRESQATGALHVLRHNGWVAGYMTADMSGKHACIEIVATTNAVADVKLNVLAFVEVGDTLRLRLCGNKQNRSSGHDPHQLPKFHSLLLRGD